MKRTAIAVAGTAVVCMVIYSLGFGPAPSVAQEGQQSPPDFEKLFAGMNNSMNDMTIAMVRASILTTVELMAEPAVADQIATFDRNYYDALIAKGFSESQAFQLVAAADVPLRVSNQK